MSEVLWPKAALAWWAVGPLALGTPEGTFIIFIKFYQVLSSFIIDLHNQGYFLQFTGDDSAWAARKDVNLQYSCNKKLSPACTGTAFYTGRSLLTYIYPWRSDLAVLTFVFIAGSIGIKNVL